MVGEETIINTINEQARMDLAGVGGWAVLSCLWAVVLNAPIELITAILALPLVFVCPGYAVVVALFPADSRSVTNNENSISRLERAVLTVIISILLVPVSGLLANYSPGGFQTSTVLLGLSGLTGVAVAAAVLRRSSLPSEQQFVVTLDEWFHFRSSWLSTDSLGALFLNVLLVLVVLAAMGSIVQAVFSPTTAGHTETYILAENESGKLVADDYPTEMTQGEMTELTIGLENHYDRPINYTIVLELQRMEPSRGELQVLESESVAKFTRQVGTGEQVLINHSATPTMAGDRLRLVYLIYAGETPQNPTIENADQEVHLWVNVSTSASRNEQRCLVKCG